MSRLIVGPTLYEIQQLEYSGAEATLATAFYSGWAFNLMKVTCDRLNLYVRLDLNDLREWVCGSVDPEALLRFCRRHEGDVEIRLRASPNAHAKAYVGRRGAMIGSANFSKRGLSGDGHEILHLSKSRPAVRKIKDGLADYGAGLAPLSIDDLKSYVDNNRAIVRNRKRRRRRDDRDENILLPRSLQTPQRLGSYDAFIEWLRDKDSEAAQEIVARSEGKHNLQGHIRHAFFGLRQFFLLNPDLRDFAASADPKNFHPINIDKVRERMAAFSTQDVVDEEPGFASRTWRTYTPVPLGGHAAKNAGNIGSLKQMMPLMAIYLTELQRGH